MTRYKGWLDLDLGSPPGAGRWAIIHVRGHVHMTSAQGGGEGGTQKEDEIGQGGRGVWPIWMSYFWDEIRSSRLVNNFRNLLQNTHLIKIFLSLVPI